jgi:neutral ceramidase
MRSFLVRALLLTLLACDEGPLTGSDAAPPVDPGASDAGTTDAAQPSDAAAAIDAAEDGAAPPSNALGYRVGAAKVDVTGPFVGSSTGYNSPGDELSGLGMRLYARTFVIEDQAAGGALVALVTADMIHAYQSVKMGVIKRLVADGYGAQFNASNVLVSATHTHSAPSNVSWYTLFNLFNGVVGFDAAHYELLVDGIAASIERAYESRRPALIKFAQGTVEEAAFNRSLPAYAANQDAQEFDSDVDKTMTLLRFDTPDGLPLGLINWFGVHGTSLGIDNRREHGDNKGWAAYEFERSQGGAFVAAFAQGSFGDVSPNHPDPQDRTAAFKRPADLDANLDALENPIVHGRVQLAGARALFERATEAVPVSLAVHHTYVNFNHVSVAAPNVLHSMPWDEARSAGTCPATIGGGFLAGDEEGAPVDLAEEGEIRNRFVQRDGAWQLERYSFLELPGVEAALGLLWPLAVLTLDTDQYDACQKEKFSILPVGEVSHFWLFNPDVPLVPVHLPFQLIKLGSLAIVALPFEVTTMAGRRVRAAVERTLGSRAPHVVIAGMANAYGQYLTTREEYAAQHFEGAFTTYGPWSEAATTQEITRLAADLLAQRVSNPGTEPPDLADQQFVATPIAEQGVPVDNPGASGFGSVLSDAQAVYRRDRDALSVSFQGAHPRSIQELKAADKLAAYYPDDAHSYLAIERKTGAAFSRVADDGDPLTAFDWKSNEATAGSSEVTIRWLIRDQPPGTYRVVYYGLAKTGTDSYRTFTGSSREFELR